MNGGSEKSTGGVLMKRGAPPVVSQGLTCRDDDGVTKEERRSPLVGKLRRLLWQARRTYAVRWKIATMNTEQRKQAKKRFFDQVEYEVAGILRDGSKTLADVITRVRSLHPHDDADIVAVLGLMRLQHKSRAVLRKETDGTMRWSEKK